MNLFTINTQTCNKDGLCAADCSMGVIRFEKGEYPVPVEGAGEICINCGHCVAICPNGSLSHNTCAVEACSPVMDDLRISSEQCAQLLKSCRTIRTYQDKPVEREVLSEILETARFAPSGHNTQGVEWVVLTNKDEIYELSGLVVDWARRMKLYKPDVAASMNLDLLIESWDKDYNAVTRNAPALVVTHGKKDDPIVPSSSTIAVTYFEPAAVSSGLGCCWNGFFSLAAGMHRPLIKALEIPKGNKCFNAMMVGYPKYHYHRIPQRNPLAVTWR